MTIRYFTFLFTISLAVLATVEAGIHFKQCWPNAPTMLQAIAQARSIAQNWSPQSELVCVVSCDSARSRLLFSYLSKFPRTWNVIFFDPVTQKNLVVHVGSDQVLTQEAFLPYTKAIEESRLRIDSHEAKALVVSRLHLPPDTVFHYLLLKEKAPTLYVFYTHSNRRNVAVVDATRGEILSESP